MRNLPIPTDDNGLPFVAGEVFNLCISQVRNPGLRARLMAIEQAVSDAAHEYDAGALAALLHTFPRNGAVAGVTREEMIANYDTRTVPEAATWTRSLQQNNARCSARTMSSVRFRVVSYL